MRNSPGPTRNSILPDMAEPEPPGDRHGARDGRRGSSLLEILVAMVLLAMGLLLLPMVQMTSIVAKSQTDASRMRTAVELGQSAVDRFRDIPWGAVRSSPAEGFEQARGGLVPAFSRLPSAAGDSVAVHGTAYYRLWHVAPDTEIPNLKTLTVWCCWRGKAEPGAAPCS